MVRGGRRGKGHLPPVTQHSAGCIPCAAKVERSAPVIQNQPHGWQQAEHSMVLLSTALLCLV